MLNVSELIRLLQYFNQDSIFIGTNKPIEEAIQMYSNLSKEEVISKKYRQLCGGLSIEFQKILLEYGVKAKYVGIYHLPIKTTPNNKLIFDDFINNTGYIDSLEFDDIYSTYRWTHVVLEISVGNKKRIIDPTTGIFYDVGKEYLLRGVDIMNTLNKNGQLEFLKDSIHIEQTTYYYLTEKFWKSVYYLGYNNANGDDITQQVDYNKYEIDQVW